MLGIVQQRVVVTLLLILDLLQKWFYCGILIVEELHVILCCLFIRGIEREIAHNIIGLFHPGNHWTDIRAITFIGGNQSTVFFGDGHLYGLALGKMSAEIITTFHDNTYICSLYG